MTTSNTNPVCGTAHDQIQGPCTKTIARPSPATTSSRVCRGSLGNALSHYGCSWAGELTTSTGSEDGNAPHHLGTESHDGSGTTSTVETLYYYGARFYSPEMGRWISRDPLTEQGARLATYGRGAGTPLPTPRPSQASTFLFSLSTPANVVDVLGMLPLSCIGAYRTGRNIIRASNGGMLPTEAVIRVEDCTILIVVGHNFTNDAAFGLQRVYWDLPKSGCFNAVALACRSAGDLPVNNDPRFSPLPGSGADLPAGLIELWEALRIMRNWATGSVATNAASALGKCPCCCSSVAIEIQVQDGVDDDWDFHRNGLSREVPVIPDGCCETTRGPGSATVSKRARATED